MARPAAAAMAASRRTTVVLPLDPVTSATGTSCTRGQSTGDGWGSADAGPDHHPPADADRDLVFAGEEGEVPRARARVAQRYEGAALRSLCDGVAEPCRHGNVVFCRLTFDPGPGVGPRGLVEVGRGVERVGRRGERQARAAREGPRRRAARRASPPRRAAAGGGAPGGRWRGRAPNRRGELQNGARGGRAAATARSAGGSRRRSWRARGRVPRLSRPPPARARRRACRARIRGGCPPAAAAPPA